MKNTNWFGNKKVKPIFTPVKLPTKKSVRKIPKKNLTWPQAQVRYPKLKPFRDADRDGKLNMFDCKPFNKKKHGVIALSNYYKKYPVLKNINIRYGKNMAKDAVGEFNPTKNRITINPDQPFSEQVKTLVHEAKHAEQYKKHMRKYHRHTEEEKVGHWNEKLSMLDREVEALESEEHNLPKKLFADNDGDGVPNVFDAYPNDPTRYKAPPTKIRNTKFVKPVKLPTKISVSGVPKKDLTWAQAQKRYTRIGPFKDADGDGKINMMDCRPFDKNRHGFTRFKQRTPRDVDSFTAAERFGGRNLKKLKKLGAGRDRDVYNLDKDKVIKIAKNPGGMRQNTAESDWHFNSSGIRPDFHEAGKDYVVMEKVDKLSPENRKKMRKVNSQVMSHVYSVRNPHNAENEQATASALKKEFPEQEDDFDSIMDYTIVPADIAKGSSWGEKDGDVVLVDAGGINKGDLSREHRITKMRQRQSDLRQYKDKEDTLEDEGQRNAYRRLANEKSVLDYEIDDWDETIRERQQFKDKGKDDE